MRSVLGLPHLTLAGFGLAIASTILLAQSATAQPQGMQGSYVGVTVDSSKTNEMLQSFLEPGTWDGSPTWSPAELWREPSEKSTAGIENQFQGRLDLPNSKISARGAVFLVDKEVKAVMPMLSYDLAVTNNTNIYAGAGYAFVKTPEQMTPVGDRNGVVLTTGVEAAVSDGIVIYGDAKLRLNRDRADTNPPVRVQVGAGYRF